MLDNLFKGIKGVFGGSPGLSLAAFGKHPGWDDHMPSLGMATKLLVGFKARLYDQGIGANIEGGAWNHLPAEQRHEGFAHLFLWQARDDLLLGRLWSSVDGKGRSRYPMVVCAQCSGLPLPLVLTQVLPLLEQLEQDCRRVRTATEVEQALIDARQRLSATFSASAEVCGPLGDALLTRLAATARLGPDRQGLLRCLYQVQRHAEDLKHAPQDSRQLRVPRCLPSLSEELLAWNLLCRRLLPASMPLLALVPLTADWLDLVAGIFAKQDLYCLQANPRALPLTSDIPFQLDDAQRGQLQSVIA